MGNFNNILISAPDKNSDKITAPKMHYKSHNNTETNAYYRTFIYTHADSCEVICTVILRSICGKRHTKGNHLFVAALPPHTVQPALCGFGMVRLAEQFQISFVLLSHMDKREML